VGVVTGYHSILIVEPGPGHDVPGPGHNVGGLDTPVVSVWGRDSGSPRMVGRRRRTRCRGGGAGPDYLNGMGVPPYEGPMESATLTGDGR
jgi:hypothetical protein